MTSTLLNIGTENQSQITKRSQYFALPLTFYNLQFSRTRAVDNCMLNGMQLLSIDTISEMKCILKSFKGAYLKSATEKFVVLKIAMPQEP